MPSDSDHPIDPALRAYARKRREEAGDPVLHPATRRMLQAEVSKAWPRSQPAHGRAWAWLTWPRLAFAAAACAALGAVLWNALPERFGRPSEHSLALLRKAEADRAPRFLERGTPVDAEAPPAVALKGGLLLEESPAQLPMREVKDSADRLSRPTESVRLAQKLDAAKAVPGESAPRPTRGVDTDAFRSRAEVVRADAQFGNLNAPTAATTPQPTALSVVVPAPSNNSAVYFATAGQGLEAKEKQFALESRSTLGEAKVRYVPVLPGAAAAAPVAMSPAPASPPAPSPVATAPSIETEAQRRGRARGYSEPVAQRSLAATTELVRMKYQIQVAGGTQPQPRLLYERTEAAGAFAKAGLADAAATAPPLVNFEFEQLGRQVRLLDTDGSSYEGFTVATNAAAFLVSGTNRASGKRLTVEGEFVADPAAGSAGGAGMSRFGGAVTRAQRPATSAPAASPATPTQSLSSGLQAGRSLYLRILPEGLAEKPSLPAPPAKAAK